MAGWRLVLCAAVLSALLAILATSEGAAAPRNAATSTVQAPGQTPDEAGTAASPDVGEEVRRKKNKVKKNNSTIGEEVITAIIDGITGESEDAAFGSDIRKEFGYLIQAVTKFGQAAANEYEGGTQSRKTDGEQCAEGGCTASARTAMEHVGEGRRRQVRRLLVRYIVLLKVFALGIILPGAVLLALLQSWKAVTVSLMALLLAGVIGLRGLVTSATKQQPEVIHAAVAAPGGHYWRRVSPEQQPEADRLAYSGYAPLT